MMRLETRSFTCARCERLHNGSKPPPGWGHHPGQGLICDECEEQLELGKRTGLAAGGRRRRAA